MYYREHNPKMVNGLSSLKRPGDVFTLPDAMRSEGEILDHLGYVDISSGDGAGFHVLVDGTVHGPFVKIKVVRNELVLPLATSFPISNKSG